MKLREARPGDMVRLYEIWQSAVNASHHYLTEDGRREIAFAFLDENLPGDAVTVVENGTGEVCAFMGWKAEDGEAVIDKIAVEPDHQRRGAASALVDDLKERHDVLCVRLSAGARAAIAFYERMGFSEAERTPARDEGGYPTLCLRWRRQA